MLNSIGRIEAAKEVLSVVNLPQTVKEKLEEEARIKLIERLIGFYGGQLKGSEIKKLLCQKFERDGEYQDRRMIEVGNVIRGLAYVKELSSWKDGYPGKKELLELQTLVVEKLLGMNEVGVYRRINFEGKVMAIEIPYQMEDLLVWLSRSKVDGIHSVIRAGVCFWEMQRIYPFGDGSEVVVRLWILMLLSSDGYGFEGLLSFEGLISRFNDELGAALENFAEVLALEAEKIKEKFKSFDRERRLVDKSGRQLPLSARQVILMEELQKKGEVVIGQVRKLFPTVSDDTILRELRELVVKKLVKKKGKTKGTKYIYVI